MRFLNLMVFFSHLQFTKPLHKLFPMSNDQSLFEISIFLLEEKTLLRNLKNQKQAIEKDINDGYASGMLDHYSEPKHCRFSLRY